ncbi:MAG: hydrogenase maturation nickel metallochaperone HypA [Actinobacteria bacterium]|nr:hydrogenase maturation nickel metallochaperone HypA [Actinomycetota bacterium]
MHELAVCEAIADTVRDRASGRIPARVQVRIGYMRQVVPESLVFSWEMVTAGTDLEGCLLDVDYVPAVAACRICGEQTTLETPILLCGACDSADVELISGEEFQLKSFDVADV